MEERKNIFSYITLLSLFLFLWFFFAPPVTAQEDIQSLRDEIRYLRAENEKNRQIMQALEEKFQKMEAQNEKKAKELEEKVATQTSSWLDRYLNTQAGDRRFLITADGFGSYVWRSKFGNQNERLNTF